MEYLYNVSIAQYITLQAGVVLTRKDSVGGKVWPYDEQWFCVDLCAILLWFLSDSPWADTRLEDYREGCQLQIRDGEGGTREQTDWQIDRIAYSAIYKA